MASPFRTKARYCSSVGTLYVLTLLFVWGLLGAPGPRKAQVDAQKVQTESAKIEAPITPEAKKITSGQPRKLVLPRISLELPVAEGIYNPADKSWTLSDNQAHFALPSTLANDHEGNTLIYGHNHSWVFGRLKQLRGGDLLDIHTDNYIFSYSYVSSSKIKPDDLSAFRKGGPPTLTLQTCSGNWNEIRTMYEFKLTGVSAK